MKCKDIERIIETALFDPAPEYMLEIEGHLSGCETCRERYASLHASLYIIRSVRTSRPSLDPPEATELTTRIMVAIEEPKEREADPHETSKRQVNLRLAVRLLAAATIALFLTFTFEQFRVLQKVTQLENGMSTSYPTGSFSGRSLAILPLREPHQLKQEDLEWLITSFDKNSLRTMLMKNRIQHEGHAFYTYYAGYIPENRIHQIHQEIISLK